MKFKKEDKGACICVYSYEHGRPKCATCGARDTHDTPHRIKFCEAIQKRVKHYTYGNDLSGTIQNLLRTGIYDDIYRREKG